MVFILFFLEANIFVSQLCSTSLSFSSRPFQFLISVLQSPSMNLMKHVSPYVKAAIMIPLVPSVTLPLSWTSGCVISSAVGFQRGLRL